MSGLENVLGNVYGDKDDQPQESDLSDVQESIDALARITDPGDNADVDEVGEPEEPTALDELADWIGFDDENVDDAPAEDASNSDDQDDIFATNDFSFLDDDTEEDLSGTGEGDGPPDVEAAEIETGSEGSGHSRAEWLDNLDDVEAETGQNWMDELTEDPIHTEPGPDTETPADLEPITAPPVDSSSANEGEEFQDAGPTLDDLAAATAPTAPTAPSPEMPDEDQDEQWLDDLFQTDGPDDETRPPFPADVQSLPPQDESSTDIADPSTVAVKPDAAATSDASENTSIADIAANTDVTPAWSQLQATTAEASASAAGIATMTPSSNTTPGAALAGDWIRSDDDILPARGRGKRRKEALDIAELAPGQDPIELFAPAEADEPKPKRSRKSKRNNKEAITAESSTDETVKVSKPKRSRKSKRNDTAAAASDTSTDSEIEVVVSTDAPESDETATITESESSISGQVSAPGQASAAIAAESPEVDQAPPATGPQPTSLKEVLADPPIIGDVGMPEPPDAVEAFFDSNEALADVDPKKSKRKLFRKSGK